MKNRLTCTFIATLLIIMFASSAFANSGSDLQLQGELLAKGLISGRGVVAKALSDHKINDPSIGDKGFTAEVFENKFNAKFLQLTGIDIIKQSSNQPIPEGTIALLQTLLDASKQVVTENQEIINLEGVAFKGFIPATYGQMSGALFQERTGITLKQTSNQYRNSYNAPDTFELATLSEMEQPSYPTDQLVSAQSATAYRVMKPIYIKNVCLKCHGDPKGELDVAGRKKEGYHEGELRGAISVVIPTH